MYKYFILALSVSLMYYLLFVYKHDKQWKRMAIVVSIGGLIASVGGIFEDMFPSNRKTIKDVFVIPVFACIIIMFYLLIPMAWKLRKDPDKKAMIYTAFAFLIFTVIFVIIVLILNQFGFFG